MLRVFFVLVAAMTIAGPALADDMETCHGDLPRQANRSQAATGGKTVTVHLTDPAFPRRRAAARPTSSILRSPAARRPVMRRPFTDPLGSSTLRAERDLLNRIKPMLPVQSPSKKYSCSLLTQITPSSPPSRPNTEGRFAIVTNVRLGCDGREQRC
jgi:hypothetical protein